MKPMLAVAVEDYKLTRNMMLSPKLDGVRALVKDGVVLSRSLKPIPSRAVQELFGKPEYNGFDGELIVGSFTAPDCYNRTVSAVMSRDGGPEGLEYFVFDNWELGSTPFIERHRRVDKFIADNTVTADRITPLGHATIIKQHWLEYHVEKSFAAGFEGVILRDPMGPYKFGRSTVKEGWMLKIKRYLDDEATIVGFEEKLHNDNPQTRDERGYAKRSSHKENKHGANTLGAFIVQHPEFGEFAVGTGMDDHLRQTVWNCKPEYIGRLLKFKYMPHGMKDKPRHPVFLGFRSELDL